MNKLMLSMLTVAAMGTGGSALAVSGAADCQTGIAWGPPNPGCEYTQDRGQVWPGPHGPYLDPRIGYYDPRVYNPGPRHSARDPYGPSNARPARRDRDGDGVRNRDDRWPDDPRRH